jgi:hypothetical protein
VVNARLGVMNHIVVDTYWDNSRLSEICMRGDFGTDEVKIASINVNNRSSDGPRLK